MCQEETSGPTPSWSDAWLQLPRLGDVGIATSGVALRLLGHSAIVEGTGVVRIELDGLVVVVDGAVVLAFVEVGVAAIGEGQGVVRIELDGLVEILDGAVVLAFVGVGAAAIVEG